MTQQPTIRRARPLDVVNLYRLVSSQGEFDRFGGPDEARALVQVLDAIQNGFVLVAENKAGRLVATIGFDGVVQPSGDTYCVCQWFAVNPSYRESSVTADFLDLTVRATRGRWPVSIPHKSLPPDSSLAEAAEQQGFRKGLHDWWLKARGDKEKSGSEALRRSPNGGRADRIHAADPGRARRYPDSTDEQ